VLGPSATSESEPVARAASSDLGLQNDLFALALTAKAEGKNTKALSALGQLLQRWPRSALAENARAEKMRLLAQMGRKAAAVWAARDYLAYHPSGFAHAEATSLLATPSP
jgi:thioredoxin-like negative regulator of GroEL